MVETMREYLQGKILFWEGPRKLRIVTMKEMLERFCPDPLARYGVESVR